MAIKTEYKYIKFVLIEHKPKTDVYEIASNHKTSTLGEIRWNSQWRQYVFHPYYDCIFSKDCLSDIIDFIKKLGKERILKAGQIDKNE